MAISPISPVGFKPDIGQQPQPIAAKASESFAEVMKGVVSTANQQLNAASQAVADLDSGKTTDLNSVVMESVKADLNFRFLVEMRNRLTATYQELSRMQF